MRRMVNQLFARNSLKPIAFLAARRLWRKVNVIGAFGILGHIRRLTSNGR